MNTKCVLLCDDYSTCVITLVGVTNVIISSFFSVSWTGLLKSNGSLRRRSGLGRFVRSFMAISKQVCLTDVKPGGKKYYSNYKQMY